MTPLVAIAIATLLFVPLAMGALIALVALPHHRLTRPRCRRCSAPLSALAATGQATCSACGTDGSSAATPQRAAVPERRPTRRMLLLVAMGSGMMVGAILRLVKLATTGSLI